MSSFRSRVAKLALENPELRGDLMPLLRRQASEESDTEGKFEKGKPADPTKNMSPADKAKWEEENEKHLVEFKTAWHGDPVGEGFYAGDKVEKAHPLSAGYHGMVVDWDNLPRGRRRVPGNVLVLWGGTRVPMQEKARDLRRVASRAKSASLDARTLDQLVEMEAEAFDLPNWRDAEATPAVRRAADNFERALSKALSVWVQKHPPEDGSTVEDLMDEEAGYNVFMTLEGHGVGIWDGRWDHFYKNTTSLEKFLERALAKEHGNLKDALEEAAFETGE